MWVRKYSPSVKAHEISGRAERDLPLHFTPGIETSVATWLRLRRERGYRFGVVLSSNPTAEEDFVFFEALTLVSVQVEQTSAGNG